MKNKPKVSVLMPVYKTPEKYLKEAIESILEQTFSDFELLILDDCPINSVENIVKSYADIRIKYFKNEKNLGISPTRNKLIQMSNGEYLAVMDHDDISLPQRFEEQVKFLDENLDYGVVGSQVKSILKNNIFKNPTNDNDIRLRLMRSCCITHPASMIRKSVLIYNNIAYEKAFSPSEDYALWCRLIPFTKFYNIPKVLFLYREHEENTSKIQSIQMSSATLAIHSFVKMDNLSLHEEFLLKATNKTRIYLFGFIPLISIVKQAYRTKIYLFEKILLFSCKNTTKF